MHCWGPQVIEAHLDFYHLLMIFTTTCVEILQLPNKIRLQLVKGNESNVHCRMCSFESCVEIHLCIAGIPLWSLVHDASPNWKVHMILEGNLKF